MGKLGVCLMYIGKKKMWTLEAPVNHNQGKRLFSHFDIQDSTDDCCSFSKTNSKIFLIKNCFNFTHRYCYLVVFVFNVDFKSLLNIFPNER